MLSLVFVTLAATVALAQKDGPAPPLNPNPTDTSAMRLNGKAFPFNALPYQADTSPQTTNPVYRGPQSGYNICNSTTAGPTSMCQTIVVNDIKDFCIYAPATLKELGDAEGEVVAYCTNASRGARVIPAGTITGLQVIKAPSYIEVTGTINQANLNLPPDDFGGELDSGGQDLRGNPMGGLAYSTSLKSSPGVETQSRVWHLFIGGGKFCMKLCDDKAPNAAGICRHTLDRVGCAVNVPAAYQDGVFEQCDGDDQLPVDPANTAIPASSNCQPYQSTELFPITSGVPTAGPSGTTGGTSPTGSVSGTGTVTNGGIPTGGSSTGGSNPAPTSSGSGSTGGSGSATGTARVSVFTALAAFVGLLVGATFA